MKLLGEGRLSPQIPPISIIHQAPFFFSILTQEKILGGHRNLKGGMREKRKAKWWGRGRQMEGWGEERLKESRKKIRDWVKMRAHCTGGEEGSNWYKRIQRNARRARKARKRVEQ